MPVRVVPKGNLATGNSIKSMDASLSKVTIYGSQAAVDSIEQLEVEINVDGLNKDKEYNVTLNKPRGIRELSSKTMTVKVVVDKSSIKKFDNISVQSENLEDNLKVQALSDEDRQVTVIVEGSEEAIKDLQPSDITAYIDLKNYGVGEHEIEVKVSGTDLRLSYRSKTKKIKVKVSEKW